MTTESSEHRDLFALFDALDAGELDDKTRAELEKRLQSDPEARRLYLDYMNVDALLRESHAGIPVEQLADMVSTETPETKPLRFSKWWYAAAAACIAIGVIVWLVSRGGPGSPVQPPDYRPVRQIAVLAPGWEGHFSDAEYEVTPQGTVRLEQGELFIKSVPMENVDTPRGPLTVETPNGTATAAGTEFYVGTHTETKEKEMKSITRVLILSGAVTLANTFGTIAGAPNDLLVAEKGKSPVKETVKANSGFAIDMYKQLVTAKKGKNVFFSPYSVSSALAMTAEGARGNTAAEMGKVLHFPNGAQRKGNDDQLVPWEAGLIQTGFKQLNRSMAEKNSGFELRLANGLCVTGYSVDQSYKDLLKKTYDAEIFAGRLDKINGWVKKKTDGHIPTILEQLSPDSVCVILNAVYFKGQWKNPFNKGATRNMPFQVSSSKKVKVPTMSQRPQDGFRLLEKNGFQALEMPYKDGAVSMVILLPKAADGLAALEKQMTADSLAGWMAELDKTSLRDTYVYLPKFKVETDYDLIPPCKSLGMKDAFEMGTADFGGINKKLANKLCINQIKHKAFCDVNEYGTLAAAATAVEVMTESMGGYFHAKHPFLYLIRHNESGTILFMGRVMDPTPTK